MRILEYFYKAVIAFILLTFPDYARNLNTSKITAASFRNTEIADSQEDSGTSNQTTQKTGKKRRKMVRYISPQVLFAHIAKTESTNTYNIANPSLKLGKYQAGKEALMEFGYSENYINAIYNSVDTVFSNNGKRRYVFNINLFPPSEQERFIRWFVNKMETYYLKETIQNYVGKEINGIYITKAGILNASMLGFSHVKQFLETNGKVNFSPSYRNSIKSRLKQFEKVDIKKTHK